MSHKFWSKISNRKFRIKNCGRIFTHIAKSWKIFPKKRVITQRIFWKIFPPFFLITDSGSSVRSIFGKKFQPNFLSNYSGNNNCRNQVMTQRSFRKFFPDEFYLYLLRKKNVWKIFPDILPSHDPDFQNLNFYFKSSIMEKNPEYPLSHGPKSWKWLLEKFSKKSPVNMG